MHRQNRCHNNTCTYSVEYITQPVSRLMYKTSSDAKIGSAVKILHVAAWSCTFLTIEHPSHPTEAYSGIGITKGTYN